MKMTLVKNILVVALLVTFGSGCDTALPGPSALPFVMDTGTDICVTDPTNESCDKIVPVDAGTPPQVDLGLSPKILPDMLQQATDMSEIIVVDMTKSPDLTPPCATQGEPYVEENGCCNLFQGQKMWLREGEYRKNNIRTKVCCLIIQGWQETCTKPQPKGAVCGSNYDCISLICDINRGGNFPDGCR